METTQYLKDTPWTLSLRLGRRLDKGVAIAHTVGVEKGIVGPAKPSRTGWFPFLCEQRFEPPRRCRNQVASFSDAADELTLATLDPETHGRARGVLQEILSLDSGKKQKLEELTRVLLRFVEAEGLGSVTRHRATDLLITPAGARSTAYNREIGDYVGLHLDNQEELPLEARSTSFHVLGANLGTSNRFLSVIPWNVNALLDLCQARVDLGSLHQGRLLVNRFFESVRRPELLQVRLPPGCIYLLSTQNYIHDGRTSPDGEDDLAVLIAANFSRGGQDAP